MKVKVTVKNKNPNVFIPVWNNVILNIVEDINTLDGLQKEIAAIKDLVAKDLDSKGLKLKDHDVFVNLGVID